MSESEEEKVIPIKEPEQITPEYRTERSTEKNEDRHALHMDYILVNHEENSPPTPEAWEARESTCESGEFPTGPEETGLPGTLLAALSDSCQPVSFSEREDGSVETMSPKGDKRSSLESPGQDQSWMVLGHSEGGRSVVGS